MYWVNYQQHDISTKGSYFWNKENKFNIQSGE